MFAQSLNDAIGIIGNSLIDAVKGNWNATFTLNETSTRLQASNDLINNEQALEGYVTAPYMLGLNDVPNQTSSQIIMDLAIFLILFYWYFVSCLVVAVSEWVYRKAVQ
jgi:hypothetical protein